MGKKLLLLLLVVGLLGIMAGAALASDPSGNAKPFTFTEGSPENANIPTTTAGPALANALGASAWTYIDASDASAKTEGSYRAFDDQSGIGKYTVSPHGGYSTTSNKCNTCHAVHRATGSFALLRVDNPDDSCTYCHVGSHRHADGEAYFGGGSGNIYPANGHTIGAGKQIPDSSTWQWTEDVTLNGKDDNGNNITETFSVRRYLSQRNKIMRYIVHGNRFIRVGPQYLRCMSCHQVHNATRQIWRPAWSGYGPNGGAGGSGQQMVNGYKLLRNSPSGGITVNPADIAGTGELDGTPGPRASSKLNFTYYDPGATGQADGLAPTTTDYRIKAVESTITISGAGAPDTTNMGPNKTGYTPFEYTAPSNAITSQEATELPVWETSLAFWCADCHNLNIAGKEKVEPNWGTGRTGQHMLADRSHVIPSMIRAAGSQTALTSGSQCYACHNNDMPLDARTTTGGSCGGCHIQPATYQYYKSETQMGGQTWAQRESAGVTATVGGSETTYAARSDFPHAGPSWGYKLLNARDRIGVTGLETSRTGAGVDVFGKAFDKVGGKELDMVCKTCHGPYKERDIGFDK